MNKIKFLIAICLAFPCLALSQSDGLFWSARLNNGSIQFYRSDTATIGASDYVNSGISTRYLKLTNNTIIEMTAEEKHMLDLPEKYKKTVDGVVVEMTAEEKYMVDLPEKYKKTVDGVVVEMTAEEKHMVDLPEKYKKTVDGVVVEMTAEEKNAVDAAIIAAAEQSRQNAKPAMLKQIENLYVTYLTNDWTKMLQSKSIVSNDVTINVTNTTYAQNMVYLMTLRAIDRDNYIKFASEFKLFEETISDVFKSSIADSVWHE